MRARFAAVLAVLALTGCGQAPRAPVQAAPVPVHETPQAPPIALPTLAAPAPLPEIGAITAQQPRLRVDGVDPARGDVVAQALAVEGVAFATLVQLGDVVVQVADGQVASVAMAAVDPLAYRVFMPPGTAEHVELVSRLLEGDAAFTHEVGRHLGLQLASEMPAGRTGTTLRIGAFASNGTPPIAHAIVNRDKGAALGVAGPHVLLASVTDGADLDDVAARLGQRLGVAAQVIPDPRVVHEVTFDGEITPDNVWDVLAQCESSGDWQISTGNGYYGGLQFLPESWELVGGDGLPHEASREEQIYRATLLWELQGWAAWPVCSRKLGLR